MALRTPLSVTPHLYMGDSTGRPLDMGTVYFGEQDKDPEFYPIELFSDDALTLPLMQPVHTKGGYLYDKGDMVEPHAKELIYSVKVLDSYGRKVFYKGAMMRNSWNDDVIEQINSAIVGSTEVARQVATDITNEAINNTAVEGGVLADTFVTVENAINQRQINRGLASVADMLSINNPKTGLKVYVNSYLATGDVKGGGYFTYDSTKATINNQGTIINGWVRQPSNYIDMYDFGGDTYTGDGFAAAQAAIDFVNVGGTVALNGFTGEKAFDGKLTVNKPMKFLGNRKEVSFKLKDNSAIFNGTAGNGVTSAIRANELVSITSSDVDFSGIKINCNNTNNYVMLNSNKYYISEEPEKLSPDYASKVGTPEYGSWLVLQRMNFRYLATIVVKGAVQNVEVHHNTLLNNSVHAIGVIGGVALDPDRSSDAPNLTTPDLYANNVKVYNNTISGGCRSGIYFIGGVINSEMYNNFSIDWGWAAFRFYFSTNNCKMYNNVSIVNTDVDATKYENDNPTYLPELFGVGYRVGHRYRGAGSCHNSTVENNRFEITGSHPMFTINEMGFKALRIEELSKSVTVEKNTFIDRTTRVYDFNTFYTEVGFCISKSTDDIKFRGNKVVCGMPASLHFQSSGNLNSKANVIIDGNNEFSSPAGKSAVHIYGSTHSSGTIGANSADFIIKDNTFDGNEYSAILLLGAAKNTYVQDNLFRGYDNKATTKLSTASVVQIQNGVGVDLVTDNKFEFKSGHNANINAVKMVATSKGAILRNTITVDKEAITFGVIQTGMRQTATGSVVSKDNTILKLER